MYPSVRTYFRTFNTPIEGAVSYMYLDIDQWYKAGVTIGMGNNLLTHADAQKLPFKIRSKPGVKDAGRLATAAEIKEEWDRIKDPKVAQHLSKAGHKACEKLDRLELASPDIDNLIVAKLTQVEDNLKHVSWFNSFETWPADAQLGLLSMAWAGGSGLPGKFKKFREACYKMDFKEASINCHINDTHNPGLVPRNAADYKLFSNAAVVVDNSAMVKSILWYPLLLQKENILLTPQLRAA